MAVSAWPKCKDPVIFGGGSMMEKVFGLSVLWFKLLKLGDTVFLDFSTILGSYFMGNIWFSPENIKPLNFKRKYKKLCKIILFTVFKIYRIIVTSNSFVFFQMFAMK